MGLGTWVWGELGGEQMGWVAPVPLISCCSCVAVALCVAHIFPSAVYSSVVILDAHMHLIH